MEHPNAYLTWEHRFACTIVIDDVILPVQYNVNLRVVNQSTDVRKVSIAYNRIKTFINELFDHSVLVKLNDETGGLMYSTASKIVDFVEWPSDIAVAMALFHKLNSIAGGVIIVDTVYLSSSISDNMECSFTGFLNEDKSIVDDVHSDYDWSAEFVGTNITLPWYLREDSSTSNVILVNDEDDPVICNELPSWDELGLGWEEPKAVKPKASVVNIEGFNKPFTPEILPGGKKK